MRKQTNLAEVKLTALALLSTEINETPYSPMIVKHPFTDTGVSAIPDGKGGVEMIDLTEDDAQFKWRQSMARQIDKADKAVWITLPMARQAADRIARELGAGSIEECVYLDFESSVPQITADQFGDMQLFDKLNGLAEKLPYLSPQEQMKFKAVLSAEHPADLDDIDDIIANLNKYELSAYVDSDSDFFKSYLEHHLGIGFDHKWLGGLFAKDEGARLLERLGATNTDYGVISARGGTLHDLVPYDEVQAKELTTQALTDEKLEVVEVLGQTALFTNGRVTEQLYP